MKHLLLVITLMSACGGTTPEELDAGHDAYVSPTYNCSVILERQNTNRVAGIIYDEDSSIRDLQATLGIKVWGTYPEDLRVWLTGRYELVEAIRGDDGLYWAELDVRLEPNVSEPLKLIDVKVYSQPDICLKSSFLYYIEYNK